MNAREAGIMVDVSRKVRGRVVQFQRRRARRVDLESNRDDHECARLAALGMSTAYIMEQTGLSAGQVSYRIKFAGLTADHQSSRADFRNGRSPFCSVVLMAAKQASENQLIKHLRKYL